MLLAVVEDRHGRLSEEEVRRVYEQVDVDQLWERYGGPAVDCIERLAGRTSKEE